MHSSMLLALLSALFHVQTLAAPHPLPQDMEYDSVDSAPNPIEYTPPIDVPAESVSLQPVAAATSIAAAAVTDVASTLDKRGSIQLLGKRDGNCAAQLAGTGPQVSTPADDDTSFLAYQPFQVTANTYINPLKIPLGYELSFSNLQASSQTTSYLGYTRLASYDPATCASRCNAITGCIAFNIYFERDPSLDPNAQNCPNPKSVTNIKCVWWGVHVTADTAKNFGQYRDKFHAVIAGSNGYNKLTPPPTIVGFTAPIPLLGTINAPLDPITQTNTYLGQKFFSFATVQTYANGAAACVKACSDQSAYNARHPPAPPRQPDVCNQVVVFVLSDAGAPQGIYCALYTESWDVPYATNIGQYRGNGNGGSDFWGVSQVWSYTTTTYAASFSPICALNTCAQGSFYGGSCGGYGVGTC